MTELSPELKAEILRWEIGGLVSIIGIAVIAVSVVAIIRLKRENPQHKSDLFAFLQEANGLRILTVFTVILAALFLAITGNLTEGATALLSSIAGYVLGSMKREKPDD